MPFGRVCVERESARERERERERGEREDPPFGEHQGRSFV